MKRVCLKILKCSVEPKAEFMAQHSNFREKTEPVWLKGRYAPKGNGAAFGIGWLRDTPESRYPTAAFLSARRGVSYGITSRDFVCQTPNQKPQFFLRLCSLRADRPQSPGKERYVWGKIYESLCVSRQKKKMKYNQKPESVGFQLQNI